jgi:two-component system response regulator YesN
MYDVLIVDDESIICEGISKIIDWRKYDFNVIGLAGNGREAMEIIKNRHTDLVITDIRMPAMDGLELSGQIKQYDPNIKVIIVSGYGDFEYARKAIEYDVKAYLLKPVIPEELLEQLRYVLELLDKQASLNREECEKQKIIKDKLLYELVSGPSNAGQIISELERYNVNLAGAAYNVAVISIENHSSASKASFENTESQIRDMVESYAAEKHLGYTYEDINGAIGILTAGSPGSNEGELRGHLTAISVSIEKQTGAVTVIGIGTEKAGPENIFLCRREALRALERKITDKHNKIFSYRDLAGADQQLWSLKWNKGIFIKSVEDMDEDSIKAQIQNLIDGIVSRGLGVDIIRSVIINIMFELSFLIQNYSGDASKVFGCDPASEIEIICGDLNTINEWILDNCRKTIHYIMELRSRNTVSVIDNVLKYIDENYAEDISLFSVAGKFYVNSAYLGQLFKEKTGLYFSQYLNTKRIEKAKKLYRERDLKVYEIIEKAGFKHTEYFYRQFLKYEGITFAEYRDRLSASRSRE